jgi:acetyl-CoA C-acetyltransferase
MPPAAPRRHRAQGARRAQRLNTAEVDDIIWGTSTQRGKQGRTWAAWPRSMRAMTSSASGVTLDRFCGSGITAVNLAAASHHVRHGRSRDRRRHRDDELHGSPHRRSESCRPSWTPATCACAPSHPQSAPGRLRRRHRDARRHRSREALDALALVSQQRADVRHPRRAGFKKSLVPVYNAKTARSRSTARNFRARRRRWKASPR